MALDEAVCRKPAGCYNHHPHNVGLRIIKDWVVHWVDKLNWIPIWQMLLAHIILVVNELNNETGGRKEHTQHIIVSP